MSNNLVLRRRKETACNPWDCWACCWPASLVGLLLACGLAAGPVDLLLALWACYLASSSILFSFSALVCT
jgi:hypothetical protein